ncbi:MAG: 2,3-bisphosphoglycerate-independent phosphoglycerate mutase [Alphaproteobacteria bacterium]|nr:2,3-bisphosphoglycerate-independent phosphoglycerate mutase [Alphaproteobacteria bacterium]
MSKKPLVLCILDGFGFSEKHEFNAVYTAKTPTIDKLWNEYPHTLLHASGLHVGLPDGQMGNSEVGHTAIGLGRVIFQDLPRISKAGEENTIKDIPELKSIISKLKENGQRCHLWGLLSDGGIHSHIEHLFAIADVLLNCGIKVLVHACIDGRDTPPRSAEKYIDMFENHFGNRLKISTLGGRYFQMDRDKRWERTEQAYNCIVRPVTFWDSPKKYIEHCYKEDISDEFIPPVAIDGYDGVQKGDAFIVFNFRADRVRQMLTALTDEAFSGFVRPYGLPEFSAIVGVTEYASEFKEKVGVMFKRQQIKNSLGEVLSKNNLTQLRAAETEKYPHVTFFFNGGVEDPFDGEDRALIPSPKVETYDLAPEMSAKEVTDSVIDRLNKDDRDVYVINFANPDMVGHTGNFEAAISAIECVDECVKRIFDVVYNKGGCMIVTADHGNAEEMFNFEKNQPHTAHTTNLVPFILVSDELKNAELKSDCGLRDIAPTMLDVLGLKKPDDMTGESLIFNNIAS